MIERSILRREDESRAAAFAASLMLDALFSISILFPDLLASSSQSRWRPLAVKRRQRDAGRVMSRVKRCGIHA